MKIQTKLIIMTLLGVFLSISVSVIVASFLINQQNQNQNQNRLTHAFESVEKSLLESFQQLDNNYQNALQEKEKWAEFETLLESEMPVETLLVSNDTLTQQLEKIGLLNNMNYVFYSNFGESKGQQILAFSQKLKQIVIEAGTIIHTEFGVDLGELEEEIQPLPALEDVKIGYGIQIFDDVPYMMFKGPYTYQGEERPSGLKPAMEIGFFIFKKSFPIILEEQERFLGVNINIYSTDGKLLGGTIPMPDLTPDIMEGKAVQALVDEKGESYDAILKPLVFQEQILGFVSMGISQKLTSQKALESSALLALSGGIILLLVGVITFLVIVGTIKPLVKTVTLLNEIADIGGNLTQRMEEKGSGEIKNLATAFNRFIVKVQHIIQNVLESTEILASSTVELSSSTTEMTQTSNGINQAILDENQAIQEGSQTINDMNQAFENLFQKIKDIQAVATASKEIALHGGTVVEKTNETMTQIAENSKKIAGVMQVITEIANQTNLLSLNAAIEAAKAGEAGKGFAVVADEIRSLADRSSEQVEVIQNLVYVSQESVKTGVEVIADIQNVFNQIQSEADRVLQNVNEVTNDISDQEKSMKNVITQMDRIAELSQENSASVQELSTALSQTDQTTEELSKLAEKISSSLNEFQV